MIRNKQDGISKGLIVVQLYDHLLFVMFIEATVSNSRLHIEKSQMYER